MTPAYRHPRFSDQPLAAESAPCPGCGRVVPVAELSADPELSACRRCRRRALAPYPMPPDPYVCSGLADQLRPELGELDAGLGR